MSRELTLKGLELNEFVEFEFDIKGVRQIDMSLSEGLVTCFDN